MVVMKSVSAFLQDLQHCNISWLHDPTAFTVQYYLWFPLWRKRNIEMLRSLD